MPPKPENPSGEQLNIDSNVAPDKSAAGGIAHNSAVQHPVAVESTQSTKAERREFFIPVSGFVWLFPEEVHVVNHPAFQRLGRIYQLGQAYVVYRGATHKRLEHAIGSLHVVQRMIKAVKRNSTKAGNQDFGGAPPLSLSEERFVRLGALMHDIGHVAAGHTVEDELNLVPKHDGDRRLDLVLDGTEWVDSDGRTLAKLIDVQFAAYVPEGLRKEGISASQIVRLLIRKEPKDKDAHVSTFRALKGSSEVRVDVCRDMIGNTICADLLDYIHRDWYHVGKPRPFDDRLLQYMEIRRASRSDSAGQPRNTDKFVISLGRRPKIRTDAISNILELLEWRYQLAETVLFHRTKLAAAAMLDRALFELWGKDDDKDAIVRFLLPLSDEEMLRDCRKQAEEIESRARSRDVRERAGLAKSLLRRLENRELFSYLSTRFYGDLPGDVVVRVQKTYGKDPDDVTAPPRNRNAVLRALEADFGLPYGSLAMYCPAGVNAKIAEVKIAVSDEIKEFNKYEQEHHEQLAGGHLAAQLRRFDRLWRVHFFIDRRSKNELGERLYLLQQAVEKLALGHLVDEEAFERVSWSIAKSIVQVEGSPWKGREVFTSINAARDSGTAPQQYTLGAPAVKSFIGPE